MVNEIELDKLVIKDANVRAEGKEAVEVTDLIDSIKVKGVLQPIIVRPIEDDRYEIVAGQRRVLACRWLGMKTIPATIKRMGDAESVTVSLVENIQRKNIDPITRSKACNKLLKEYGGEYTIKKLAEELGVSQSTINKWIGLLEQPKEIQEMVEKQFVEEKGGIGEETAARIRGFTHDPEKQKEIAEIFAREQVGERTSRKVFKKLKQDPDQDIERVIKGYKNVSSGKTMEVYFSRKLLDGLDRCCKERVLSTERAVQIASEQWLRERGYLDGSP